MNKIFSYACEAVSSSNTALTQAINAKKTDEQILYIVIKTALQSTYNIGNDGLFTALAKLNPTYKPVSSVDNTALDMAVMFTAGEVIKSVYQIKNIELCPSMPLTLEDVWNHQDFTRALKGKIKKEDLLENMTTEEKEKYAQKQLNDDEGGCSGGACKL